MSLAARLPRRPWIAIGVIASATVGAIAAARSCVRSQPPGSYAAAREVVNRRCLSCHSERPTNRAFPIPPKEIMLDTAEQMQVHAERIRVRAVVERTMPFINMSGMTEEERAILGRWVEGGARTP